MSVLALRLRDSESESESAMQCDNVRYRGVLHTLEIVMREEAGCERLPHMDMSEQCKLAGTEF